MQAEHSDLPTVFPSLPVSSSQGLGWSGLAMERYQYSGGEYYTPSLPVHAIVQHLNEPIRMIQKRDGKTRQDLFPTHNFIIVPAGASNLCWHKETADELFITVDPGLLAKTAEGLEMNPANMELVTNFGVRDKQLEHIVMGLTHEVKSSGSGGRILVEALASQLAVHLLHHHTISAYPIPKGYEGGLSPQHLRQTLDFINDQLDQDLSLNEIAACVHLSPYHFARLFKQSVGVSPHQYVISRRVEIAKQLLSYPQMTPAQVVAKLGFADYSHLSRHFKRIVGLSPSEFQRRKNLH